MPVMLSLLVSSLAIGADPVCELTSPSGGYHEFGLSMFHAGGLTFIRDDDNGFVYDGIQGCAAPILTTAPDVYIKPEGAVVTISDLPSDGTIEVAVQKGGDFKSIASVSDPQISAKTRGFGLRHLSGDRLVAGAGSFPYPSDGLFGVYVAPTWDREDLITIDAFGGAWGDYMGFELSGWTLLHPLLGRVRIWERQPGGNWREHATGIDEPDRIAFGFGTSVDIWRDTIAVGTPYGPDWDRYATGAVYVYERQPDGAWVETAELVGAVGGARFGFDVQLWGNLLVVGAQGDTTAYGPGHVEVYRRTGSGWERIDVIVSPDPSEIDLFGSRVELWANVFLANQTSVLPDPKVWVYEVTPLDQDGDGFDESVDCADLDPEVHPGAPERCNQLDDDCNESVDEGCPDDAPPQTGDTGSATGATGSTGSTAQTGPTADTGTGPEVPPEDGDRRCGCNGNRGGISLLAPLLVLLGRRRCAAG